MAQPGINAKIEELQFRIKTDPKSRLFFPLAEELRKNGRLSEAERVLRTGLGVHSSYLSAWVSLGRVLREQRKNAEAVDALTTALQVDPGNVVAARLLADAYLDLGEKVEAIKKYKLVHALMPSDEELEAKIDQIDRDIRAEGVGSGEWGVGATTAETVAPPDHSEHVVEPPAAVPFLEPASESVPEPAPTPHSPPPTPPYEHTIETPFDTDDEIPMAAQHAESPFEEPSGYTADALEIEQPEGMHVEEAPLVAEAATPWVEEPRDSETAADVFAPAEPESVAQDDDITATTTMADLYVRQGLIGEARKIYEHMLDRDPSNDELRDKLAALDDSVAELPGDQVAELPSDWSEESPAVETTPATWQPGNPATESTQATWQPGNQATQQATWQPGNPETEDAARQPGDPATLHRHAKVVALEQWLAKVCKREPRGA